MFTTSNDSSQTQSVSNTRPQVTSATPASGATNIATSVKPQVVFSEAMKAGSVTTGTIKLSDSRGAPVAGAVSYDSGSFTATISPANNLASSTRYTVSVTTGATDTSGLSLGSTKSWTFTTGTANTPPTVTSVSPASGASGVAKNTTVQAVFNEAMTASSITSSSFKLAGSSSSAVAGSVSYNSTTRTATFTPSTALIGSTTYTATVTTLVEDATGLAMVSNKTWAFTTTADPTAVVAPSVSSTTPNNGATGIPQATQVKAVFSKAMNSASITSSTFMLSSPNGSVAGRVSYNSFTRTATFVPSANLSSNVSYTAALTTGVKDTSGVSLAAQTAWSFTTAAIATPTPVSTSTPAPSSTATPIPTSTRTASPTPTATTTPAPQTLKSSGQIVVDGKNGVVIENLQVSNATGGCIIIRNSTNITVRNSDIGKCLGNAIEISSSSNIKLVDNYIHSERAGNGCNPCDMGDNIFAFASDTIVVQGNVITYGEANIEMLGVSNAEINGNYLLNPLGPYPRGTQIQFWSYNDTHSSNVRVENNYALASRDASYAYPEGQSDAFNFGGTDGIFVQSNYITGGQFPSGCGLIADGGANQAQFLNNVVYETGGCGIGIASGTNQVIDGNKIYNHGLNRTDVGNTAMYVWSQYPQACGPVTVKNNISVLIRPDTSFSSWWDGGGCGTTTMSNNTFDQAAINAVSPLATKMAPPASIPPVPYATKVVSPFSR